MKAWMIPVFVLLGGAALAIQDEGAVYYVGHNPKYVNITFESEADLETIIGTTHTARGEIHGDPEDGSGSVAFRVPVKSLKTGIEMRDEHLRSKMWMDAENHPYIRFKSTKVEPHDKKKGVLVVTGDFTMHGVSRERTVEVEFRRIPEELAKKARFPEGKWVKYSTEFDVKLSDHNVTIPKVAVGKVSDTWKAKVVVFAGTAKLPEKK